MTPEQRRIFSSRPIARTRRFASLLNWRGLQLKRILFSADEIEKWTAPPTGIIAYYKTSDPKFNLQINEIPAGHPVTYHATIIADHYGISNIGWHPFTLFDEDDDLRREAARLRPWLDRRLYKNREWLRKFKRDHSGFLLSSRQKRRGAKRKRAFPESRSEPSPCWRRASDSVPVEQTRCT